MIAFLGMGLLGAAFARGCRSRGEEVNVWNRTPDKARALEEVGARAFTDVVEAVRGAARVHLVLADDASVDAVLEHARVGLAPEVILVDHTTTSADGARERAAHWRQRGIVYQHAPVFMQPQNALDATGTMMLSGPAAQHEALRPALEKMTGKLVYLGEDPGRAAAFKLLGNMFLMFVTAGVAELFTLGKALGLAPEDAATLLDFFNPGLTTGPRIKRVLAADFEKPSWELVMARKDARLMIEAGERGASPLQFLPSIAAVMDRFIERGDAHADWTVIAKDALTPKA